MRIALLVLTVSISGMMVTEAWAYLDPGTGSVLVQGILGGIAAFAVVIKLYWAKFTGLFKKKKS